MRVNRPPITVLDLRDSPWVDGPGRTILDCAETMDTSRARIAIGAFDGGSSSRRAYEEEARRRGLEVFRIRERRALDPGVLGQVIELCRSTRADVIHAHDFRSNVFGYACARRMRVPFISTAHGWIANNLKGRIQVALDKAILRRADHLISVSEETRSRLGKWASPDRCTVIPNAVRVERYQPQRGSGRFRESIGVGNDELLIANIGRLSPEKGQAAFLAAAREILRRHRNVRFILFGLGPDQAELERFVSRNALGPHVKFVGYRSDMDVLYNELDLVVQSSSTEGMPNVVIEALLMEVPVIATDVGGTREVLKHEQTGMLIEPGRHQALVDSIENFLANKRKHMSMAREGRQNMLLRFNHARRVERLADVYERVIHAHGGKG